MASDTPIWHLINLLRLKRAIRECLRCQKVAYRTYWDALAIADLTFAVQGEAMHVYQCSRRRRRWGWHLCTVRPRSERTS